MYIESPLKHLLSVTQLLKVTSFLFNQISRGEDPKTQRTSPEVVLSHLPLNP